MTFTSKAVKYWPSNCHTSLVHCSVAQLCPTFHDSMDYSMPVHYHLPECLSSCLFISDAIQPSHPLMPSSSALNLSQHHGLLWVGCLHQVTKILELQPSILPMSIQWWFPLRLTNLISFRMDWLDLFVLQGTLKSPLQHHSSVESINSSALSLLYGLTSIHDYWKNHSFD